jgi:hypothetical protein
MPPRRDPLCPQCHRKQGSRLKSLEWLGGRELLLGAAALGLVAGLGWASEGTICEQLGDGLASQRGAALERYVDARCEAGQCESIELVSTTGCRAKVRVIERRVDDYGDEIGVFRVDEGLEFSPVLERWRMREELDVKQVLGLPAY